MDEVEYVEEETVVEELPKRRGRKPKQPKVGGAADTS